MCLLCVGLAQNFAALRALVTEGIQRGHMSLHARNIAIAAGAPTYAIEECVRYMSMTKRFHHLAASEYLAAHELYQHPTLTPAHLDVYRPSTFCFCIPGAIEATNLNILFQTFDVPVTIMLQEGDTSDLVSTLFGLHSYSWLSDVIGLLDQIELTTIRPPRQQKEKAKKLKCLSMLMNIMTRKLLSKHPEPVCLFLKIGLKHLESGIVESAWYPMSNQLQEFTKLRDSTLSIGLSLLLSLWQVFEYRVSQWIGNELLASRILTEQRAIFFALMGDIPTSPSPLSHFQLYMRLHSKRFQVTMFLLCDAISFDTNLITTNSMEFICNLGFNFEYEQTAAHDLSPRKLARDLDQVAHHGLALDASLTHSQAVNGFLFWLHRVKKYSWQNLKNHSITEKKEFVALVSCDVPTGVFGFRMDQCGKATHLYREYYHVQELYE